MSDENVKRDIEQAGQALKQGSKPVIKSLRRFLAYISMKFIRFVIHRFSPSTKALKKDGPTEEIIASAPVTRGELKSILAKANEDNIRFGVKEMSPEGDVGHNRSLHYQEKVAKHEIKATQCHSRSEIFAKIKPLRNFYRKQEQKYLQLSKADSLKHTEKSYMLFVNVSHLAYMNKELASIKANRTTQLKTNDLQDINKDGVIDERDIGDLKAHSINMNIDELDKVNEDYGDCLIAEYKQDYCTQKVSKAEYCSMREALFDLRSHGARTLADGNVLVAIAKEDLPEYQKYAPSSPIKEYGKHGGTKIQTVQNDKNLQSLKVETEAQWQTVTDTYKDNDYIATHHSDGSVSFLVLEQDTKAMVKNAQKKSTTETLLEEANKFYEQDKGQDGMEKAIENTVDKVDSIEMERDS